MSAYPPEIKKLPLSQNVRLVYSCQALTERALESLIKAKVYIDFTYLSNFPFDFRKKKKYGKNYRHYLPFVNKAALNLLDKNEYDALLNGALVHDLK